MSVCVTQVHVAETLVAACRRMEHVPEVAAHAAILAQEAHGFPRLVRACVMALSNASWASFGQKAEEQTIVLTCNYVT
eukprot:1159553-Pelagomonas_calceolata.AAC.7